MILGLRTSDDRFKVSLNVSAGKIYADAIGNERPVPFDMPIDIGLFLKKPGTDGLHEDHVISLEKRRLTGPTTTLEWIVDKKPAFAGIDPYNKLIDREPDESLGPVAELETQPSAHLAP